MSEASQVQTDERPLWVTGDGVLFEEGEGHGIRLPAGVVCFGQGQEGEPVILWPVVSGEAKEEEPVGRVVGFGVKTSLGKRAWVAKFAEKFGTAEFQNEVKNLDVVHFKGGPLRVEHGVSASSDGETVKVAAQPSTGPCSAEASSFAKATEDKSQGSSLREMEVGA